QPLTVPYSVAFLTAFTMLFVGCILRSVKMPLRAFSYGAALCVVCFSTHIEVAPSNVLGLRNRLKVTRIYAVPNFAQMVNLKPVWYMIDQYFVHGSMGNIRSALPTTASNGAVTTSFIDGAPKQPTFVFINIF